MIEDTKIVENGIEILCQVTPGENVSKTGEDIHKGEVTIDCPKRLKPQHLGLIAALGLTHVEVYQRPQVAVLATGNELTRQGEKLEKGKIYETNSLFLNASTVELGAEPIELGIAKDDIDEISQKLKVGLKTADMILTSGGTSVGGPDLVPIAVNTLGKPGVIVHGIAMRPGMPTALAVLNGKPILILPGNPVASMFGFEVFARPVLCMLLGLNHVERRPVVEARMTKSIPTALGRRSFVRVHVFKHENQLYAKPISARGSSMMSTVTNANGYVIVPENREGLLEKDLVSVELFDALEE
jgi:molybdopterin molybdotransferase